MRGENKRREEVGSKDRGTSPRARGKRGRSNPTRGRVGNIPACAGKTYVLIVANSVPTEHPRVRGENSSISEMGLRISGTSPRARGKRDLRHRMLPD